MGKVKELMIELQDMTEELDSLRAENNALYEHIEGMFDTIGDREKEIVGLEIVVRKLENIVEGLTLESYKRLRRSRAWSDKDLFPFEQVIMDTYNYFVRAEVTAPTDSQMVRMVREYLESEEDI